MFRSDNEPSILSLLRAVKLAWTGDAVQETSETSAEGDPQSNGAAASSVNVVKGQHEDEEPQRKRHRPKCEGEQPLAPPGEGGGSSSSSGPALPPPQAPPPLEPPPLAKRGLEQETDATVEQQGESKRCREHQEVPQAADSSSRSSSSSESSTDTEMGLADVHDSL